MATPEGREILRYCMLGISLGVIGQSVMEFATLAAYARRDAGRPLRAVALRAVLAVAGMLLSLALLDGPVLMLAVGISIAVSDIAAGALLCWAIRRPLPRSAAPLGRTVITTLLAGLAMLPVVLPLRMIIGAPPGQADGALVTLLVGAAGAVTYLGVQWVLRSPEMTGLLSLLPRRRTTVGTGCG